MPAFIIASVAVKDPAKMAQYAEGAGPTIAAHGGEMAMRGALKATLSGTAGTPVAAIIRFETREAAETWYSSPEYQALIPLRDEACAMTLNLYETPS